MPTEKMTTGIRVVPMHCDADAMQVICIGIAGGV